MSYLLERSVSRRAALGMGAAAGDGRVAGIDLSNAAGYHQLPQITNPAPGAGPRDRVRDAPDTVPRIIRRPAYRRSRPATYRHEALIATRTARMWIGSAERVIAHRNKAKIPVSKHEPTVFLRSSCSSGMQPVNRKMRFHLG
ncbi:hypothetical protein [Methylobacterium sp. J-068]|uniref:hypothetical protein n=1 Tax=Methylobacterium sp. J-068 TaxID=2836649 RepID=UPI001FBBCE4A|nr:hypothetical protein [Methylobacterium sp. J-068]MCJ2033569.1 hypothetical protein [Methylobacterium sp. J-068]